MPKRKRDSSRQAAPNRLITLPNDVWACVYTFLHQSKWALLSQTCSKLKAVSRLAHASLVKVALDLSSAVEVSHSLPRQRPRKIFVWMSRPSPDTTNNPGSDKTAVKATTLLRAWTPGLQVAQLHCHQLFQHSRKRTIRGVYGRTCDRCRSCFLWQKRTRKCWISALLRGCTH